MKHCHISIQNIIPSPFTPSLVPYSFLQTITCEKEAAFSLFWAENRKFEKISFKVGRESLRIAKETLLTFYLGCSGLKTFWLKKEKAPMPRKEEWREGGADFFLCIQGGAFGPGSYTLQTTGVPKVRLILFLRALIRLL